MSTTPSIGPCLKEDHQQTSDAACQVVVHFAAPHVISRPGGPCDVVFTIVSSPSRKLWHGLLHRGTLQPLLSAMDSSVVGPSGVIFSPVGSSGMPFSIEELSAMVFPVVFCSIMGPVPAPSLCWSTHPCSVCCTIPLPSAPPHNSKV